MQIVLETVGLAYQFFKTNDLCSAIFSSFILIIMNYLLFSNKFSVIKTDY